MRENDADGEGRGKNLLTEIESFVKRYLTILPETELSICLIDDSGKYIPTLCKIEIKLGDSENYKDQDLDYGDVRFIRFHFPTGQFTTYVEALYHENTIRIPAVGNVAFNVRSPFQIDMKITSRYVHKYSQERWFFVRNDWPYYLLTMQLDDHYIDYQKPLLRKSLPAYAQYNFAITDFFGLLDNWQVAQIRNVFVVVPDPRGKIEHLQLTGSTIVVSLKQGSCSLRDLIVKVFAKKGEVVDPWREIKPESDQITLDMGFEPEFVSVYLLENETGEEIDWKQIDLIWGSKTNGTGIGTTEDSLIQWIDRGEGENVEFKSEIEADSTKLNFKKSVTAFSNTRGGLIFIGIDDEGVAKKDCNLEDEAITNYVQEIEPMPEISLQRIAVDGKRILVVRVEEGKDKPYNLKYQGIFIRRGRTNSRAGRLEIQKFFEKIG